MNEFQKDADKSVKRFKTCKHSDGLYCYEEREGRFREILDRVLGVKKHAVGVNSYSVRCHCLRCGRYEKK